jgi:CHAT domain-containing protein/tetratricopeptide (TPR) repeat protein
MAMHITRSALIVAAILLSPSVGTAESPPGSTAALPETASLSNEATSPPDRSPRRISGRVDALRAKGAYAEALQEVLACRENYAHQSNVPAHAHGDIQRWIATLGLIMQLPPAAQRERRVAESLHLEISWLMHAGEFAIADELAQQRLAVLQRHLGAHNQDVARVLHDRAVIRSNLGDDALAEKLFVQVIDMRRAILEPTHADIATTLQHLGALRASQGDEFHAEELYREALGIYMVVSEEAGLLPDNSSDIMQTWARIANLRISHGDYVRAEPLLRRALAAARKTYGTDHWLTATLLNNLAVVRSRQGDRAAAEPLFREALTTRQKDLGENHPHTVQSMNALAVMLHEGGDLLAAEALFREVLLRYQELPAEHHSGAASVLLNLATLIRTQSDYAAAEALCRQALAIYREDSREEPRDIARCLGHLGSTYMEQGRFAEAEGILREALSNCELLSCSDDPDRARARHRLALCLLARDDPAAAQPLLADAAEAFENARLRAGRGYTRATFQTSPYTALAVTDLALEKADEAWVAAERALGRALVDLLVAAESRSLDGDETAVQDSLLRVLRGLEDLAAQATDRRGAAVHTADRRGELETLRARLAAAEAAWCAFHQDIAARHPVTEGQAFSLQHVQEKLTERTAFIGWVHLEMPSKEPVTWGYVIRKEGPVLWARLDASPNRPDGLSGAERASDFRETLATASAWVCRPTVIERLLGEAQALWECWVAPLMPHLDRVDHLVVIPSGPMLGVPFEALADRNDTFAVDRFFVSYVPSATIHTWLRERGAHGEAPSSRARKALLAGDPPFSIDHLTAMQAEERRDARIGDDLFASAEPIIQETVLRSALAGNEDALASLPRLPRTRDEIQQIASLMPGSVTLLGPDASEQEFVRMAESGALQQFDTIHLATHALVDDERPERSALVLSRADLPDPYEAAMTGERLHDGLLTAKEIVREWNLEADLVTLSGCQTGLGREAAGEGHIGLAHAFLRAGARSLLVSLWKVEEEASALLMTRFYENLTGSRAEPMSKVEALREAKQWLRDYTDVDGTQPFRHPSYWSGFILIGEP